MARDPMTPLAMAIHATPGAYAVLCGSGTSSGASIMTGWDIALDLVRQIAILESDTEPPPLDELCSWYRKHHGEDVDYSRVLEYLGSSSGDRQAILDPYFEPTEDEGEQGLKAPTGGHRALANLVKAGFVRVIVTTNFDQLIEQALRDAGVAPLVIATADDARNAPPLHAQRCVVIKVHGDRMSPNLKNTLAELDAYEPDLVKLLQQVLREYGLIVCGWSADWDPALRNLIVTEQPKVYSTFWAHRGEPSTKAQEVIKARIATAIAIEDADDFFGAIEDKVFALRDISTAGPTDVDIVVAQLKRHLADPTHRIRLHDLVNGEVERVVTETSTARMPVDKSVEPVGYIERVAAIEKASRTVIALFANLGYFGNDDIHDSLAIRGIERLATANIERAGREDLLNLQRYRALLGLYALGLGALAAHRPRPFARVLAELQIKDPNGQHIPIGYVLAPINALDHDHLKTTAEFNIRTPTSELLHRQLRGQLSALIPDQDTYDGLFDDLEYLLGLAVCHYTRDVSWDWAPIGRFIWRRESMGREDRDGVIRQYPEELLNAGLFNGSADELQKTHEQYEQYLSSTPG